MTDVGIILSAEQARAWFNCGYVDFYELFAFRWIAG